MEEWVREGRSRERNRRLGARGRLGLGRQVRERRRLDGGERVAVDVLEGRLNACPTSQPGSAS
jgi:hypothetical protein